MALQADGQGFLIGTTVDIGRMVEHFQQIRADVAAIRRAVIPAALSKSTGAQASTTQNRASGSPRSSNVAVPIGRDAGGRFVAATSSQAAKQTGTEAGKAIAASIADPKKSGISKVISKAIAEPLGRNSKGRLATAVRESASGTEEVDPTIKAAKEIAEPLSRGYEVLFGGGESKKQNNWLRKIFSTLNVFRKEETLFSKTSTKVLKEIESKTGSGGDGESSFSGGAVGSLLGRFLPWLLGGLATAGATAAWGLFTEDGRKFFADIGTKVSEGWESAVNLFKETFPGITKGFEDAAKVISDVWEPISAFFKDKFGIVSNVAEKTVATVKEQVNGGVNYLEKSSPKTMGAISKAKELGGNAWEGAKSWVLGQTSKLFESGKGGAGTVSSGKGDFGGASYGTYQLSSKAGTLQNFLKSSKYGDQFNGLAPGSAEFNAKWKYVASSDPEFGNAQHEFIKNTHFDPAMSKLAKSGIDLSGRGAAVQDSLWSTSVQFGSGGGSNLIKNALAGRNVGEMSDSDLVSAIQDYKLSNNDRLFASSSDKVRLGTASRALAEKEKLISLASVTASSSIPSPPVMPQSPKIPEAPAIEIPLNSQQSRPMTINLPSQDVGQDLSDRSIAHIATGGFSARP